MREFNKYMKIRPVYSKETQGIFEAGELYIFEKLDGCNVQVGCEEGKLLLGSRNKYLTEEDKQFSIFWDWAHSYQPFLDYNFKGEDYILYGEWLVKHTVSYKEDSYRKFYLFDVFNWRTREYEDFDEVAFIGEKLGLETIPPFYVGDYPGQAVLDKLTGKTNHALGKGEGIVIKNYGFRNKYDRQCYAKIVCDDFKEEFAGKIKQEKSAKEDERSLSRLFERFVTKARVEKLHLRYLNTVEKVGDIDITSDMRDMRWLPQEIYNDLVEEASIEIIEAYPSVKWSDIKKKLPGYVAPILKDYFMRKDTNARV